jgi:hypothetical protein
MLQRIMTVIGVITALVAAYAGLMAVIPDAVKNTQKVIDMLPLRSVPSSGMQISGSAAPTSPEGTSSPISASDPGPAPHPGCHEIMSTDSGVFPPKVVRLWKC